MIRAVRVHAWVVTRSPDPRSAWYTDHTTATSGTATTAPITPAATAPVELPEHGEGDADDDAEGVAISCPTTRHPPNREAGLEFPRRPVPAGAASGNKHGETGQGPAVRQGASTPWVPPSTYRRPGT